MRTRALTASEAVERLAEIGYKVGDGLSSMNCIKDNAYTLPYGATTFQYVNPTPNTFNPALLYWEQVGVRYSVWVYEDVNGNSNVYLFRWNGSNGCPIANYNKMKAAEKKAFIAMLETAERYTLPVPQRVRDGYRDASYKDENGVYHTAYYDPAGNYIEMY